MARATDGPALAGQASPTLALWLADSYADGSVMVTGAGGSIGYELCRQVLAAGPRRLVMMDISEPALFEAERRLAPLAGGARIVPVLGSAGDAGLVRRALRENGVEVVLHAAAYKHVAMVEANPLAGMANNALATHVLAQEAVTAKVARFVLISSDKAVRPVGVMGASKRLAEMVVQDHAARPSPTRFSAVRFGNVFGSSGSVVPIWREQIAAGGPVTLTHPQATRYFMTVEQAVHLVLVAGAHARGGEVFVLDMGVAVAMAELARRMILGAGRHVAEPGARPGGVEIRLTGLRPGERLHEEPVTEGARPSGAHPAILTVAVPPPERLGLATLIGDLRGAVALCDADAARDLAARIIAAEGDGGGASEAADDATPAIPLAATARLAAR